MTRPKLIDPVQIALGTRVLLGGVSPLQGLLPSQVVAARSKGTGRSGAETHVEVDGRQLRLTNLDKVLYPATGFTKGQVVDYYTRVAPAMLPHLEDRPVTMVRLPDGVEGERFFEKRCPGHRPDWLATVPLDADSEIQACSIEDLPGLVWTANLAALELHTPQARAADPWHPTAMVFDLDPGAPADIVDCARVALDVRDLLDQLGLARRRQDVGLEGHPPLGRAASVRRRRRDQGVRARGRAHPRIARQEARDRQHGARPAAGQGVRRLEPERPPQDDRVRVLVARDAGAERVDADLVGRGRGRRRTTATADTLQFEPADVLARVDEHGDLYAGSLADDQELPELS